MTAAFVMCLALLGAAATAGAQTLPAPWKSVDIGNPPVAGSVQESAGTFTIQASGADIWGTSDQFRFLYQQVTGDVDVIARVDAVSNANAWSKAGVMIRSSLAADAAHAYTLVSAGKGYAFQRRRTNGGSTSHTSAGTGVAPEWTRLVRKGTTISSYVSRDGVTWTRVASDTVALGTTAYVGIAVTSHASALTTAKVSQVAVNPLSLPDGYASADIGATGAAGAASYRTGTFYVSGAGADIWDTSDQFQFVYRQATGDVDVRARVASLENVRSWTKAGVMIRESLAANSRHGMMVVSAGKGYAFQRRTETGGLSAHTSGGSGTAPGWVRVVRSGTRVEAYRSADGVTWQLVDTDTIAMGQTVYVGLALSSHATGILADATFDNVTVTESGGGNAPPSATLTAPAAGSTFATPVSTTLTATASDSDGSVARVDFLANNTLVSSDSTAPYSATWSPTVAGTYSLTAVAYDNDGASTASAPVNVTVTSATNKPPTVSLTSPTAGAKYTAPATITVSANASDPEGALARVDFYGNGTLIGTDRSAPYTVTVTGVPNGSYAFTATAVDVAGNATTTAAVNVTVGATANQPPTVSVTSPASGASFTAPASITISASASDPEGALSRVDFYANGSLVGSDTTSPYSVGWSNVAAGSYSITAVARDAAGNATTSTGVSITVGSVQGTAWQVAFTASPDHATVSRYVLEVFAAGANPDTATPVATSDLGKPTPDSSNNITVDRTTFFTGLKAGSYIATVRAENSGGSSRSTPISFTR